MTYRKIPPPYVFGWLMGYFMVSLGYSPLSDANTSIQSYQKALNSYENILRSIVKQGKVDYKNLDRDRAPLDHYIRTLPQQNIHQLTPLHRKALFINAYNAFTISLVLEYLPNMTSIKDIPDVPIPRRWHDQRWRIGDITTSLHQIEHQYLAAFDDPRVYFALANATMSGPDLSVLAYRGEQIHAQLDRAMRQFLNNEQKGMRIGSKDNLFGQLIPILYLSKIFYLHLDAFGDNEQNLIHFILPYVPNNIQHFFTETAKNLRIKQIPYDWQLNSYP